MYPAKMWSKIRVKLLLGNYQVDRTTGTQGSMEESTHAK